MAWPGPPLRQDLPVGVGVQECVGAGQLVRRGQGKLDSVSSTTGWGDGLHMSGEEEKGEGNLEDTPRALSWANWLHGRTVLTQGNQRDLLDCPLPALQTPHYSADPRPLLPILGPQRQASHQDVGDESHGCGRQTHRHRSEEEGPSGPPGT